MSKIKYLKKINNIIISMNTMIFMIIDYSKFNLDE